MKAPWAGFKPDSLSKGTITSARISIFINWPALGSVGNLKKSNTSLLIGNLTPQSNAKVSYLPIRNTCGNFLVLKDKRSQECNKKLLQWKSVSIMPLQTKDEFILFTGGKENISS